MAYRESTVQITLDAPPSDADLATLTRIRNLITSPGIGLVALSSLPMIAYTIGSVTFHAKFFRNAQFDTSVPEPRVFEWLEAGVPNRPEVKFRAEIVWDDKQ